MKTLKHILAATTLLVTLGFASEANAQVPLENFFKNPEKAGYQISPDGKYFSYMAPYENRLNLFVQEVGSDKATRITSETVRDLAGSMWANGHRILYIKDTAGDENFQLYGVNVDGTDPKAYTAFPKVRTTIIDPLENIDSLVIIGLNKRNPQVFDPYRLNLNNGELTQLAENPGNIQGWMTDHNGKLRVALAIVDGVNTQILYRETEEQPFRPVLTTNFKETVSFATFTPDNKMVYALTNIGRDKTALVLMDPATCEEKEVLYTNDKYDISGLGYSELKKKLISVSCTGHKGTIRHYFDKYGKGMGAQGCVSWSFDRKGVIIIDNEDGDYDEDAVMMDALDAGADDFNAEDNVFEITTDPDAFNDVVKALEEKNYAFVSADISLVPQTYVKLESDEDIKNMEKLLDMLDDNEDVQNTYHNWDQD